VWLKLLMSAFLALNVWLCRVSGGRTMGKMGAAPILLLTTTGRRSRRERTVSVLYLEDGGRFVMVASLAGAPRHPAWFLNLEANPRVRLQVRSQHDEFPLAAHRRHLLRAPARCTTGHIGQMQQMGAVSS
jgi:F420H(2)-dependent quinone reductase